MIELIVAVLVLIWMAVVESRLSRLVRIARATHDLVKELVKGTLEEQKKGNEWLEKIATRTERIAPRWMPPPIPTNADVQKPVPPGQDVYRID